MDDLFITKKLKYTTLKKTIQNDSSLINFGTIDSLHMKFMTEFDKQNKNISKIKAKNEKIKKELIELQNKAPNTYTVEDISKKANLLCKIEEYNDMIEKINEANDELDYFTKSLPILKQYYGINRNTQVNEQKPTNNQSKDLLDFFNSQKKNKEKNVFNENETILEEYLKCTLNKNIKKKNIQIQICPDCNIEKILQSNDGHMVCMSCGHSDQIIVDMEKINFKDPYYENKSTGYKRMNHFSELMNQFQAKESTDISPKIFNTIILEIKRQRIIDPTKLTKKRMRFILKKLELNQYFEHIPFIINRLTGLPPPTITRELEEKLKSMFKEIQEPFKLFRSKKRKNFLNYNYVFHKFFELLEMDHFLQHFPLLKSPSKLREQDELWEKICKYLRWEFIPST
jgi:hypothetical protein